MLEKNEFTSEKSKEVLEKLGHIECFFKKHNINANDFVQEVLKNSEKLKGMLGNPGDQTELIKSYFSLIALITEWKPLVNIILEVAKAQLEKDNQKEVVH